MENKLIAKGITTYHTIDFEKVKNIKDIILILKSMDLKIVVNSDYEISEEILEIAKFFKKEDKKMDEQYIPNFERRKIDASKTKPFRLQ